MTIIDKVKSKKYIGILLLTGLSLFGIIAVQLYWMKNAIKIKEEQFSQKVNQALVSAAYRIERNQNAYLLSQSPQFNMQQQLLNTKYAMGSDSIIAEFNEFWNNNSKGLDITNNDKNVKVEKTEKNGIETITYGYDTTIVNKNGTQYFQAYSSISAKKGKANKKAIPQNKIEQPNLNNKPFADIMEQMVFEFRIRDITMEERISTSIIEPTLKYELKNFNIPLNFEYGIANFRGKIYDNLCSSAFNNDKLKKSYRTSLFPGDILMPSDQLALYFPEKRNYIYKSLIWPLAGSIIFTLIILITFYFTLRIIFTQKKVSEIKNDFINNMTHEFKTPIATISLAADSITNSSIINNPEKIKRFSNIIKEENKRMNRQVESVLKMALIDKKDFNLNIKETQVHQLIEQAINNISIQIEQKQGKINLVLDAENDTIKVDETHFVNIIYNLLDNANKYSLNAPPNIKVETYGKQGDFCVAISDKGIGMDKETQNRIFEKFYRFPTGNVHTVKGFGLGLSYVKAITTQFNGTITVKSNKGLGSTFVITIPQYLRK